MAEQPLLRVDHLGVRYAAGHAAALEDVSLSLMKGERLALIGESGSGKSTFARAIAHLLPPGAARSGDITWPALGGTPMPGRDLAFVLQDQSASLDPVMTIGEQVAEGAVAHLGLSWGEAYAHAATLLGRVQLPEPERLLKAYPHQLSGGQRQRVAIAAALAAGPSILIADEVTSALDRIVEAEIVALLDGLVRDEAMTLIFITHDIALAAKLADRIAVFADGRLVEDGPSAQLLARPQAEATRRLLAAHMDLATPSLLREMP